MSRGSNSDFNEGKGIFWVILTVSRGKYFANHGVQGDTSLTLGNFPSASIHSIKYPEGVVMLLITSRGNNDLINNCPGGGLPFNCV